MNETPINATIQGGAAGLVGVGVAHIENLYVGAPTPVPADTQPAGPIPPCPYPGLAYFGPQDAGRFFGREQAISALVVAVARRSFTALVGASGSGKSSVVLAGLAPRLETQGGWRSTYFRIGTEPDKNPLAAIARALAPLLGGDVVDQLAHTEKLTANLVRGEITLPNIVAQCRAANPGKRILLIADQFEEVFTLVTNEALRNRFIDTLIAAFPDPGQGSTPDLCLVLTLRADFYNAALRYRPLADRLQDHVENLGPMTRDELREAIFKPAEAVQVEFEPGLVNAILDDVEKRPGSLPLLQFALREMWGSLQAPLMSRTNYDAIGGVEGALAQHAQAIFDDATRSGTDNAKTVLFRRLFTRLVTLGDGSEDTRRIVGRDELGPEAWALAQNLAGEDNRLVVTWAAASGQETAEVVHEALIRNWPTLVEWVNLDRAFQTWLRQLKPRLDDWRANPSDPGTLLRGGPLVVAENWIGQRGKEFSHNESAFVVASIELRNAERQREEETAEQKRVGLIAVARERAGDVFVALRGQLLHSFAIGWLVMAVGEVVKSYLFATEHNWLSLTYEAYRSGQLSGSYLFLDRYNFLDFSRAMYNSVVLGLASFGPIVSYYVDSKLLLNPKDLTSDMAHFNFLSFNDKQGTRRLFFQYSILVFNSVVINAITVFLFPSLLPKLINALFNTDIPITWIENPIGETQWLEAAIYALGLTILIDAQIAGRKIKRVSNGAIIGSMIVIGQIVHATYLGSHLTVFLAALAFVSFITGFTVGWYFPLKVAAILVPAKSTLDQCYAEIFGSKAARRAVS